MVTANSCNIFARKRSRKDNKLTDYVSDLHKDLLNLSKHTDKFTRKRANEILALSQSPTFIETYKDRLVFKDATYEEPWLASLYEVVSQRMPEVSYTDIKDYLQEQWGKDNLSFEDALKDLQDFNTRKAGGTTFFMSLQADDNGKYSTTIEFNTEDNQNTLYNNVVNHLLAQQILHRYEQWGFGVKMGSEETATQLNPKEIVDGHKGILHLAYGYGDMTDLYQATGKLISLAMGESNIIKQRTINVIENNPEVAKGILKDAYDENADAEAQFAQILGYYLQMQHQLDKKVSKIKRWFTGVIDWVKNIFAKNNAKTIYENDLHYVQNQAYKTINAFLGNNFAVKTANDRRAKHVMYNATGSKYEQFLSNFKTDIQAVILLQKELSAKGANTKNLRKAIQEALSAYSNVEKKTKTLGNNIFNEDAWEKEASNGLIGLVAALMNEIQVHANSLQELIDSYLKGREVNFNNMATTLKNATEIYDKIEFVLSQYSHKYLDVIKSERRQERHLKKIVKYEEARDAKRKLLEGTTKVAKGYKELLEEARRLVALDLLVDINGSQYYAIEQHVHAKGLKLIREHSKVLDLEKELRESSTNNSLFGWSFFNRWIMSLSDSPDIINQMVADVIEQKKYEAHIKSLELRDQMFEWLAKWRNKGAFRHTREFFETMPDKSYSGNIKSERHWGQWEQDYQDDKKKFITSYYTNYFVRDNQYATMADMYNDPDFQSEFYLWKQSWNNTHSTKLIAKNAFGEDKIGEDGNPLTYWAPSIKGDAKKDQNKARKEEHTYPGQLDFTGDKLKAYDEYMQIKKQLDDLLPPGVTNLSGVRAPQFKGTKIGDFKTFRARSVRDLSYNFKVSPDDTEFGSERDSFNDEDLYDHEGHVIFDNAFIQQMHTIDRIPFYGIRKLHKNEISVDLVHSTIAYGNMAYKNHCLSEVVDRTEALADMLNRRRVKGTYTNKADDKKNKVLDKAYNRLRDYFKMQVYNNYMPEGKKGPISAGKVTATASREVSKWRLAYKFATAAINGLTGTHEIIKEATGEHYTKWDLFKAYMLYIRYALVDDFLQNIGHLFNRNKMIQSNSKLGLFTRKFNMTNDWDREFREQKVLSFGQGFLQGRSLTNIGLKGFSVTESFMQRITFIATMLHTKMRNKKTGEVKSLWRIYENTGRKGKLNIINGGKESDWEIKSWQQETLQDLLEGSETDANSAQVREALYLKNKNFRKIYNPGDEFLVDGEVQSLNEEQRQYYTELRDRDCDDRVIYKGYTVEEDGYHAYSTYYVQNPKTDELIEIFFDDDNGGIASVEYDGTVYTLNDFFNKFGMESLIAGPDEDLLQYNADYTDLTITQFEPQQQIINGTSTGRTQYCTKSVYMTWDSQQQAKWQRRVRRINDGMHGVYNKDDAGAFLSTFVGPLVASLKKYCIGLISRRLKESKLDFTTGKHTQGNWRSTALIVLDAFSVRNHDAKERGALVSIDEHKYNYNILLDLAKIIVGTARVTGLIVSAAFNVDSLNKLYSNQANIISTRINYENKKNRQQIENTIQALSSNETLNKSTTIRRLIAQCKKKIANQQLINESILNNLYDRIESLKILSEEDKKVALDDVGQLYKVVQRQTRGWNYNYLHSRGFSDNQIFNLGRSIADLLIMPMIRMGLQFLSPPEDPDEDWLTWFSDIMLSSFVWYGRALEGLGVDISATSDEWFTEENIRDITANLGAGASRPFSVKGILYYILYRSFLEQAAYNPMYIYNVYREYTSLTSNSLPATDLLYDIGGLASIAIRVVIEALSPDESLIKDTAISNINGGKYTEEELDELAAAGKSTKGYARVPNDPKYFKKFKQKGKFKGLFSDAVYVNQQLPIPSRMLFDLLAPYQNAINADYWYGKKPSQY